MNDEVFNKIKCIALAVCMIFVAYLIVLFGPQYLINVLLATFFSPGGGEDSGISYVHGMPVMTSMQYFSYWLHVILKPIAYIASGYAAMKVVSEDFVGTSILVSVPVVAISWCVVDAIFGGIDVETGIYIALAVVSSLVASIIEIKNSHRA